MLKARIDQWFERFAPPLACAAGVFLPMKLAWAYAALIPLITLWLLRAWNRRSFYPTELGIPLFALMGVALVSAFFGIAPLRSLPKFTSFFFFACSIPVFCELVRTHGPMKFLWALIAGQGIAAVHSIIDGATGGAIPRIFLGHVTESGQLALVLPAALGAAIYYAQQAQSTFIRFEPRALGIGIFFGLVSAALGLSPALHFSINLEIMLAIGSFMLFCGAILFLRTIKNTDSNKFLFVLLTSIILPLLTAALLINLKRGPWVGVFVALLILLFLYARALLLPLLISPLAIFAIFDPVRERLLASAEHFFIAGGRNTMWRIGGELALRYPLGIGYHNSPFLRNFAVDIPPEHNHFHNNLLNILVETGWLGLSIFLWWLARIFKTAFGAAASSPLLHGIGCALLSWQIAGFVEYNFGDSEVVNVAYLLIGILAGLAAQAASSNATEPTASHLVFANQSR